MEEQERVGTQGDAQAPASSRSRRAGRRRQQLIWGLIGGAVVVGATIAIVLAAGGSRSGTLVGASGASGAGGASGATGPATTAITGSAAAEFIAMLPPISITADNVQLAPNVLITTLTVSKKRDGTFTGTGTLLLANKVSVNIEGSFTDADNWSLVVASNMTDTFQIGSTGITVDPSTISGRIAETSGSLQVKLAGSTVTWPIPGVGSVVSQFSLLNACPFDDTTKCPDGDRFYLGLVGQASINRLASLTMQGGITLDATWARLEGTPTRDPNLTFAGSSLSLSNSRLVIWRGARTDSFDPAVQMPDLSSLTQGTGVELCGTGSITLPVLNTLSTSGCLRYSAAGVVIAQRSLDDPDANLSGGTTPSGTVAAVKGFAWTSLPQNVLNFVKLPTGESAAVKFASVLTPLVPSTISLGGTANLPGLVTAALGYTTPLQVTIHGTVSSGSISL